MCGPTGGINPDDNTSWKHQFHFNRDLEDKIILLYDEGLQQKHRHTLSNTDLCFALFPARNLSERHHARVHDRIVKQTK